MQGLSERAKALIPKARIMSFAQSSQQWPQLEADKIALLQQADDEKQYLSDEALSSIAEASRPTEQSASNTSNTSNNNDPSATDTGLSITDRIAIVKQLREQATEIVDEARAGVLQDFPGILEPGGGLYPPLRAEACWRDFWQFLRCITYGIAGGQPHYTSDTGLAAMQQLYIELQVPLPAMVTGLKGIKAASLKRLPRDRQVPLEPYFDHLIDQLSAFLD
jgi:allophycocyanin-B